MDLGDPEETTTPDCEKTSGNSEVEPRPREGLVRLRLRAVQYVEARKVSSACRTLLHFLLAFR